MKITNNEKVHITSLRKLPGDIGETFSESILQLLSLGHHIITGGHQLLHGGHWLITLGHQLLCGALQLITSDHHIIIGDHQLLCGGLQLITRGLQLLCGSLPPVNNWWPTYDNWWPQVIIWRPRDYNLRVDSENFSPMSPGSHRTSQCLYCNTPINAMLKNPFSYWNIVLKKAQFWCPDYEIRCSMNL